jgi:hypothetical protein
MLAKCAFSIHGLPLIVTLSAVRIASMMRLAILVTLHGGLHARASFFNQYQFARESNVECSFGRPNG